VRLSRPLERREQAPRLGLACLLVRRARRRDRLQRARQAARELGHMVAQPLALQLLPAKVHRAVAVVDLDLRAAAHAPVSIAGPNVAPQCLLALLAQLPWMTPCRLSDSCSCKL